MTRCTKTLIATRDIQPLRLAFIAGLSLLCLFLLASCGKKGFPQPHDTSKNFQWKETEAKVVGNCLAFTGSFEGEYQNFDGIRLEIARLSGPDDCPGCPFVSQEIMDLSPKDAGFDSNAGTIAFSYCPQKAAAYRWRLVGINIFNRLPHATMNDRLLVVGQ